MDVLSKSSKKQNYFHEISSYLRILPSIPKEAINGEIFELIYSSIDCIKDDVIFPGNQLIDFSYINRESYPKESTHILTKTISQIENILYLVIMKIKLWK